MKILFALFAICIAGCAQQLEKMEDVSHTATFATWVFADEKTGGEAVRKQYLDGAMKLASKAGMRELQSFAAKKVLMGDLTPQYVGLFTWPNAEAASSVRQSKTYTQQYGPLRTLGWNQMISVNVNLQSMPQWQFDPKRYYTIALVWTKSAEAYQQYVSKTASLRDAMNFSIVYSAPVVSWATVGIDPDLRAPDRVALLSWPDASVPDRYLKALSGDAFEGVADATFEGVSWHEIKPY